MSGGREEWGPYLVSISGIKSIFKWTGRRIFLIFFFFLAVTALFPETLHRKCLMCEVMSVTLKASVNSSLVTEGRDSFGKAEVDLATRYHPMWLSNP